MRGRGAPRSVCGVYQRRPWESSARLFSLYDMIKFAVADFVKIISFLELASTGDFSSDRAVRYFTNFNRLHEQCLAARGVSGRR